MPLSARALTVPWLATWGCVQTSVAFYCALLRSIAFYCVLLRRNVGMRADFYCVLLRSIAFYCVATWGCVQTSIAFYCVLLRRNVGMRADFYWGPYCAQTSIGAQVPLVT